MIRAAVSFSKQDVVPAGEIVGEHIHMEPLIIHTHEIPDVGLIADGEAGDVHRRAELRCSGVGALGSFQLPDVGFEGLRDASRFPFS